MRGEKIEKKVTEKSGDYALYEPWAPALGTLVLGPRMHGILHCVPQRKILRSMREPLIIIKIYSYMPVFLYV